MVAAFDALVAAKDEKPWPVEDAYPKGFQPDAAMEAAARDEIVSLHYIRTDLALTILCCVITGLGTGIMVRRCRLTSG